MVVVIINIRHEKNSSCMNSSRLSSPTIIRV
jgi:hypothetical protein